MLIGLVGLDVQHRDVLVEQQRNAIERRTAARFDLRRLEVPVPQGLIVVGNELRVAHALRPCPSGA